MATLTLREAAALLKIHPVTLQDKSRAGEIPGAKIGRAWVFVEFDLLECIRAQYRRRVLQGEHAEKTQCHSTSAAVQFSLKTGLRKSNVTGLKWCRLTWLRGRLGYTRTKRKRERQLRCRSQPLQSWC